MFIIFHLCPPVLFIPEAYTWKGHEWKIMASNIVHTQVKQRYYYYYSNFSIRCNFKPSLVVNVSTYIFYHFKLPSITDYNSNWYNRLEFMMCRIATCFYYYAVTNHYSQRRSKDVCSMAVQQSMHLKYQLLT